MALVPGGKMTLTTPKRELNVASICVEVEHLRRQFLSPPQLALGMSEIQPDRLAQVRQVQPAEHTMPRCVIALSTSNCTPRKLRIPTTTAKC